ncbi:MAG: hypothetical protein ACLFQ6_10195 [Candidatus Sumerlaeia bacterium]
MAPRRHYPGPLCLELIEPFFPIRSRRISVVAFSWFAAHDAAPLLLLIAAGHGHRHPFFSKDQTSQNDQFIKRLKKQSLDADF